MTFENNGYYFNRSIWKVNIITAFEFYVDIL